MKPILEVEHISKEFLIGAKQERYLSLRDIVANPFKKLTQAKPTFFWALEDVNFTVMPGESVAIIGRNGAGKSTLLKILSKITPPSKGKIISRGRMASLLEVGTGFHQELTGRENVYMNGSILGMRKSEINKHFDAIIDFSGVEKFLDTPLKHYSSGMQLRLAFAVAAHLEPEILVIDEVLAVGDAEFQKKCLGKMGEVSRSGRTVLFVSHNMAAVKQLCNTGIVLRGGKVMYRGSADEAVYYYQTSNEMDTYFEHTGPLENAPGNENIRLLKFEITPSNGEVISISSGMEFEVQFYNSKENISLDTTFEVRNADETAVFHHGALVTNAQNTSKRGIYSVKGFLSPNLLNAGTYSFKLIFGENQRHVLYTVDNFINFEVLNESIGSNSTIVPGVIRPLINYNISFSPIEYESK